MKFKTNVIHKGVFYPAGTDVPVGAPVSVETTGTVSTEDGEQLQEQAGEELEEQDKPKRGRKPKEA